MRVTKAGGNIYEDASMKNPSSKHNLFGLSDHSRGGGLGFGSVLPGVAHSGSGGVSGSVYAQRRCAFMTGGLGLLIFSFFILRGLAASVISSMMSALGSDSSSLSPGSGGHLRMDKFPESFRIAVIADLDQKSKKENGKQWFSYYMTASVKRHELDATSSSYEIAWDDPAEVTTSHNEAGRGCELSELVEFNDQLFTFDDRTGIMFEIKNTETSTRSAGTAAPMLVPRHIFMEGSGSVNDKGLKIEWATVKDGLLYVGSFGKEFTNSKGEIVHKNNLWVKTYSKDGVVHHLDWSENYEKMRNTLGYNYPGYLLHESITWSPHHRKWFVLPRRMSKEVYEEAKDEKMGHNTIVVASHDFSEIKTYVVGPKTPERGFSSAKFLPGSRDSVLIVLKSEEFSETGVQKTFIAIYGEDASGGWRELMKETELPVQAKFEGIEILI